MMKSSREDIAIDSNIIVYSMLGDVSRRHEIASELMADGLRGVAEYSIPLQALSEAYIVLTKKFRKNPSDVCEMIRGIIELPNIIKVSVTPESLTRAIDLHSGQGGHYWDAQIAATLLENGCKKILTENVNDYEGTGIEAVNPFV